MGDRGHGISRRHHHDDDRSTTSSTSRGASDSSSTLSAGSSRGSTLRSESSRSRYSDDEDDFDRNDRRSRYNDRDSCGCCYWGAWTNRWCFSFLVVILFVLLLSTLLRGGMRSSRMFSATAVQPVGAINSDVVVSKCIALTADALHTKWTEECDDDRSMMSIETTRSGFSYIHPGRAPNKSLRNEGNTHVGTAESGNRNQLWAIEPAWVGSEYVTVRFVDGDEDSSNDMCISTNNGISTAITGFTPLAPCVRAPGDQAAAGILISIVPYTWSMW